TNEGSIYQTLFEHWDGNNWSVVSSPNPGSGLDFLFGVAAVSASNVWAVGYNQQTLIEHWNGSNWSIVSSPSPGSGANFLFGVAAVSQTNAWAVGYSIDIHSPYQTLIEHWNGSRWIVVSSPNAGSRDTRPEGVAASSNSIACAVG